jgi:hypothetical protein
MLLFSLFACAPPAIDTTPSIKITWPPAEHEVVGCEVVTVEVTNFTLVEFPSAEGNVEGEGHYHIYNPNGYAACYEPYCFIDLSTITETADPYFTAVLASTDHTELTDENGDRIEFTVPIVFTPGECAFTSGGDEYGDTGADTGAR